jgi:hypothetical protein
MGQELNKQSQPAQKQNSEWSNPAFLLYMGTISALSLGLCKVILTPETTVYGLAALGLMAGVGIYKTARWLGGLSEAEEKQRLAAIDSEAKREAEAMNGNGAFFHGADDINKRYYPK